MTKQREWQQARKALGKCIKCGKPAAKKKGKLQTECLDCKALRKVYNKRAWRRRKLLASEASL